MKSSGHLSRFDIKIEQLPSHGLTRTVYIKLTGPRSDDRSRSASPCTGHSRSAGGEGEESIENGDLRAIPRQVTLWAIPRQPWRSPFKRTEWWAKVFVEDGPDQQAIDKAREETGEVPVYLDTIQMGRRVDERNVSFVVLDLNLLA